MQIELLPNGNVLMIVWERKSFEEAVAAGRDPKTLPADEIWNDLIIELAPDGNGKPHDRALAYLG